MTPPYFIIPDIDALATAPPDQRDTLVRKLAACIGDECTLRSIIGLSPDEFRNFYPDMLPRTLSTDDTISSFITMFSSEQKAATPMVEGLVPESGTGTKADYGTDNETDTQPIVPVTPAIDYALTLDNPDDNPDSDGSEGDNTPADSTSDLINSFLQAVPPKTPQRKTRKPEQQPETEQAPVAEQQPIPERRTMPDTESLRDAVKNKDYQHALEIIKVLSLNNPKKSVYFATQTRFIKKLMQIESNKRNSAASGSPESLLDNGNM